MPLWMLLALMVPFIFGLVHVIDKMVVDRYTPNIFYYAFWSGVLEIVVGVGLLIGFGVDQWDGRAVWGGIVTGLVRSLSFMFLLAAFSRGQLARITPVYYLYPLLVAPMSAGLLGEELEAITWIAVVLAVVGAGLVTWQGGGTAGMWSQPQAQAFAFLAAGFFASGNILSKYFLDAEPFWPYFAGARLGFALGMLGLGFSKGAIGQQRLVGDARTKFIFLVFLGEAVVTAAIAFNLGAINMGPVSLVSAIGALQPAVVLVYALTLSRMAPVNFGGWVTARNLTTQVAGIVAICSAVVVISTQ